MLAGFSGHGLMYMRGDGLAMAELLTKGRYAIINFTHFGWQRLLEGTQFENSASSNTDTISPFFNLYKLRPDLSSYKFHFSLIPFSQGIFIIEMYRFTIGIKLNAK